ncbi:hypothetical protein TREMEDRAFT_61218 [Tremella mesenterica DSM 1558]|uniref:uncharacterized protein n=1 Tax=Tremella mesenterica (strain ATCC 24925 / CBS 8224 / DSM 1558 / NBRC 9311 / NRRL Y-6157 / RJB 2259-6 / UBC 559-6) TaxID=578456 RepID=UPI0003F49AC2|nr:uncharacterized protein TREMEDRAFT_61218 [Tremella mesenterica DSM 1558]EIW70707.1 hypothetical protein TREMEDRAFT_61218 [Tremella mesenterica DSM 1558]
MEDQAKAVKMDSIRSDLNALIADIALNSDLQPITTPCLESPPSPTKSSKSGKTAKNKSPFSRLKFKKKGWTKLPDSTPLEVRRGSTDPLLRRGSSGSDTTLVEDVGESAADLLGQMAPLVSALQTLSPKMSTIKPIPADLRELFDEACQKLTDLLEKKRAGVEEGKGDELGMSRLLLDALLRKVQAERLTVARAASPLVMQSANPFVIHAAALGSTSTISNGSAASSILNGGSRTISSPARIAPVTGTSAGGYTSFASASQSGAWGMNVVRLGSFQASALFSPSPIAVRRAV